MKKSLIILLTVIISLSGMAQQLPQFTQYALNDYVMNPASAGSHDYFEAKLHHRQQWVGITDAPRTNILSVQGPIADNKMGVGSYIFADITGPTRRIGFQASYSYHLNLTNDIKLALGLSGGLLQFAVDGAKITSQESGDIAISNGIQSVFVPDAGFGAYVYHEKFFGGISAPQLLNNKLQFFENYKNTLSRLVNHYYAFAGYNYVINSDILLEPMAILKYVSPVKPQVELIVKAIYLSSIKAAIGYRHGDAISITAGYNFENHLTVGYSYDYTISNLNNYSSGSHEIMLGIRFRYNTPEPPVEYDYGAEEQ